MEAGGKLKPKIIKKIRNKKKESVILSTKVSQPENYTEPIIAWLRCQKRGEQTAASERGGKDSAVFSQ